MTKQYPTSFKCCATCARWKGNRTFFGNVVKVEPNEKGKCEGGAFNFAQMSENATCSKWMKK